ncbi:MAG: CPBP family intramembrane glutamic endopeptidase [Ilumatobacteraceae bacterium]
MDGAQHRSDGAWPAPTGPAVGWYESPDGRRHFDGVHWSEPVLDPLATRVGVWALAVLAASLLLSRVAVVLLESVGIPVGVLVVLLIVGGYGPPAWWCVRTVRRARGAAWRASIGLSVRGVDLAWGLLAWLSAVVLQAVVLAILMGLDIPVASNASGLTDDGIPTWYLVATALAAVVAAPLVEELVFRGVVLASLTERLGALGAIVVQGLIFGAVHADPLFGWSNLGLVLVLGTVGMVFGTAAHLTGRLGAAVIAHALFNGVVMVVLLTGVLPE